MNFIRFGYARFESLSGIKIVFIRGQLIFAGLVKLLKVDAKLYISYTCLPTFLHKVIGLKRGLGADAYCIMPKKLRFIFLLIELKNLHCRTAYY